MILVSPSSVESAAPPSAGSDRGGAVDGAFGCCWSNFAGRVFTASYSPRILAVSLSLWLKEEEEEEEKNEINKKFFTLLERGRRRRSNSRSSSSSRRRKGRKEKERKKDEEKKYLTKGKERKKVLITKISNMTSSVVWRYYMYDVIRLMMSFGWQDVIRSFNWKTKKNFNMNREMNREKKWRSPGLPRRIHDVISWIMMTSLKIWCHQVNWLNPNVWCCKKGKREKKKKKRNDQLKKEKMITIMIMIKIQKRKFWDDDDDTKSRYLGIFSSNCDP